MIKNSVHRPLVGGFLDQKSQSFQEEFPQLAGGGEEKTPPPKKEAESKELPYGPGPSLRPQSTSYLDDQRFACLCRTRSSAVLSFVLLGTGG